MENVVNNSQNTIERNEQIDNYIFIIVINTNFPQFFAEKRYKLIKFAPKLSFVDKLTDAFIIRKKELTVVVNNYQ